MPVLPLLAGKPLATAAVFGAAHVDRIICTPGAAILGASNPARGGEALGGVGLNVARSLARLGVVTLLATRVGRDDAGQRVVVAGEAAGVNVMASCSADAPTASYTAVLDGAGALVIGLADMAVYDEMKPATVAAAMPDALGRRWIVDANLPGETIGWLAEQAARSGVAFCACAVSPAKAVRLASVLSQLAFLFCNRAEAAAILGADPGATSAWKLAEGLSARGAGAGLVSDGAAPLAAWNGEQVRMFPAHAATSIVSVNGAGDALAAGTLYGLSCGLPFFEAVPVGLALAALKLAVAGPFRDDLTPALLAGRLAVTTAEAAE